MLDRRPAWHREPRVETIHDRVNYYALRNPESVAILAAGRSPLTYAQLTTQISLVGRELGLANIGGSDRVAVILPPGAEAAVATLAIAAHAACAPLNPAYSAREFEFYLSSLRAKALLVLHRTSSAAIAAAKRLNLQILYLLPENKSPAGIFSLVNDGKVDPNYQEPAAASSPALLLFTSGTTARPKLAPLTHRQLCLSADNIGSALQLEPRDRCLGVMTLFHIHGLSTLFATLVSGGGYVSMPGFSPKSFFGCLEDFQPTWYSASPAIHRAIFDSAQSYRSHPVSSALRFIRSASAPMPKPLMADMESAFGVPLIEAYGMTEAASQIASNRLPPFKRKPGSVGTIAGPDVAIMDENFDSLPAGRTGEVVIRGPEVIDGYDSDTVVDEEIFSGGWLRTGDLGHFDTEGYLFITGRLKEIVNCGGEKISPAVVEQVLLEHPAVAQAIVFGMPHSVLGETLAAAVVLKPAQTLAQPVREIRDFVADRLARFEVPQKIVIVDQIPLGPTGKLARKDLARVLGLSERDGQRDLSLSAKITPRTATERRVAEVFAEVLKTDPPGIHDDFFELGGNSLAAMQVLVRLQQIFQTTLPIDFLFAGPTVAGLAERIGEHLANLVAKGAARLEQTIETGVDHARITRRTDATPAPLSLAQQSIYFLDQLGAGAAYNISASLWLTGRLDERALALALNEIVRRHDILRTHFPMCGDHPVQMVALPHQAELAAIDLQMRAEGDRVPEAMALATEEACQPFDLENGPVFRAKLVRLSHEEGVLLLTMHHIVSDGWSISVLYKELKQLYAAFRDYPAPPLAELPLQYADFATWQQHSVDEGRLDREAAYWTRQLEHLPPVCTFPSDRPRPPIQSYCGAIEQVFIDGYLIDRLKSIASCENVTLFMTLLAAFKTLLFRYNGQEDCVVGVPIASRPQQELESLIGFFANTLVMRSSLADNPSFTEFLARVRASALGAFAHQEIPIERIMENLRVSRDLSRAPLFQVMFAFQNMPDTSGSSGASIDLFARPTFDLAPGLAARPFRIDNKTAKFDLTLYLAEVNEGMSVTWQFNTDLFDPSTIHRLAWQFQTLLKSIVDDPRKRVSELPLLSEAESRQAEFDWNRTETPQLSAQNFIQLFEAQVERTPNAIAVLGGDSDLTYRDLNDRANQFARCLQRLGACDDHRTGVCLPRTPEMLAVVLGIWKTGGAFLPLDPDYPPERIAYELRVAGVSLLVTQAALLPRVNSAIQSLETDPSGLPELVCIDASQTRFVDESTRNLEASPAADALAYMIFTSGSTGKPKGVMITHGNVCHYAHALAQALGIYPGDRYLHTASFSFSSSIRQFTVPLSSGGAVVIASTDEIRDPQILFDTIRRQNISILDLVPSFSADCLQVLMSMEPSARSGLLENHVRLMLFASEPLPPALVDGWRRLNQPATTFVNMFGQTETTGIVMTYPIPVGGDAGSIVPIGRPIGNTQAYVLDGSRCLVPVGICGELYIGGGGIGRGYINQPEQTAKSFVSNPFGRQGGKRLYRTGDLARYRSDGVIEIVGRADAQIKIGGFRIEPSEIEAAIRTHPTVDDCVVTAADDWKEQYPIGHKTLVAFVVARGQPLAASASFAGTLRNFLKQKLPNYMLPQRIVTMPRLTRTPSGKVDLQALRATLATPSAMPHTLAPSAALREPHQASRSHIEKLLTEIWKKVLHLNHVDTGDNFFDLGGNSKLSINVFFEAKQAGLMLELSQLYQYQTIAELARVVGETKPAAAADPRVLVAAQPSETEPASLVTVASLRAFGREALLRAGLVSDGAEIVTEVQLEASLRGQQTHDMVSIPRYATRIEAGKINGKPCIQIESETANTALINGDNGPGQWVSMVAMDVVMRKAEQKGIGIVSVRRSNHFGAAGHYVWEATKQGLIGICTTNGPVILAPTGGVTPTFGNNPLAVGIPAGRHLPIVLDISMSVAPRSKIGLALAQGKPLTPGWILDRFGQPSTDLADLVAGLGVPIGGHKGYGLALVLELLAGVLSGAGFASDHRPDRLHGSFAVPDYGHLFIAIDPERFMAASKFTERVDRLIDETKDSERAANVHEIWIPGERELKTRDRSLKQGVRLLPSTYRTLVTYSQEKGLNSTLVIV